jgi:hypothetical protein
VYQQLKISLTPGIIPDSQRPKKSLKRMKPAGELMEAAVDMTIGIRRGINIRRVLEDNFDEGDLPIPQAMTIPLIHHRAPKRFRKN